MYPLHLVLVRTLYPSNIGSVARVMGNMGAQKLILINPRCEVNSKSRQAAAGAQEYLARRILYSDWNEFYQNEGQGIRIGLTRRSGKNRSVDSLDQILNKITENQSMHSLSHPVQPIYLIFGPEDDGLSAEDLSFVHFRAQLPVWGEFPSLNLSHAALLGSFLVQNWLQQQEKLNDAHKAGEKLEEPVETPLFFPDKTIKEWLEAMGFSLNKRKTSAYLTLRRILLQNQPTATELHILQSILHQNIRKLKNLEK